MRWYHYIAAIFVLSALTLCLYLFLGTILIFLEAQQSHINRGASAVAIIGGFIGVLTLVLIWRQLVAQSRQSRLTRTYQFSEKLQDPGFLEHLSVALFYFKDKDETEDDKWGDYINGFLPETAIHVYITLTFFEDLAMLYNENNISRGLIKKLLKSMIIKYYEESAWFRKRVKKDQGKTMYKEWDKLYTSLTFPWWSPLVGAWESVE